MVEERAGEAEGGAAGRRTVPRVDLDRSVARAQRQPPVAGVLHIVTQDEPFAAQPGRWRGARGAQALGKDAAPAPVLAAAGEGGARPGDEEVSFGAGGDRGSGLEPRGVGVHRELGAERLAAGSEVLAEDPLRIAARDFRI